jgi:hypothetical protein
MREREYVGCEIRKGNPRIDKDICMISMGPKCERCRIYKAHQKSLKKALTGQSADLGGQTSIASDAPPFKDQERTTDTSPEGAVRQSFSEVPA